MSSSDAAHLLRQYEQYEALRQEGNELFGADDFAGASARYSAALEYCGGDPTAAARRATDNGDMPDARGETDAEKAAVLLTNRALARLKLAAVEAGNERDDGKKEHGDASEARLVAAAVADARAATQLQPPERPE